MPVRLLLPRVRFAACCEALIMFPSPLGAEDDSIHCFEAHKDSIYAVAWSPVSPNIVATGGGDDRAFLWRASVGEFTEDSLQTYELAGHSDSVSSIGFNGDGTLLATGGMDGKVMIWEVSSGKRISTLEGPGEAIEWLQWHPKGNVVLAGSSDFTTWMWNAANGQCMQASCLAGTSREPRTAAAGLTCAALCIAGVHRALGRSHMRRLHPGREDGGDRVDRLHGAGLEPTDRRVRHDGPGAPLSRG